MGTFFQGLTLGLAYVAPIGLQNLFVINSALTHTRRRALLTALIVVFFDVTLALACFFGVGAVLQRWIWLQMVVLLVGSLIVILIGVGLLRAKPEELVGAKAELSVRQTIGKACVVTWCNPQAILDGTMMLGAFRVTLTPAQSAPFIGGVMSASCLWFTGLTLLISVFSSRFTAKTLRIINLISGAVILCYGGKLLLNFFQMLF
jgi:L-lysine exporter family protein LysE/ArgO